MCCKSWKTILPFALTFLVGIFAVSLFVSKYKENTKPTGKFIYSKGSSSGGTGCGECSGSRSSERSANNIPDYSKKSDLEITSLQILSKSKALYTDDARQNQIQGTVRLRVVFLANGAIGSISVVSGLPNGLTEQAIAAARNIKFEPQTVKGKPVSVTKQINYTFTLY